MSYKESLKRYNHIRYARKSGISFAQIGRNLNLSRQRVAFIFKNKPKSIKIKNFHIYKSGLTGTDYTRELVRQRDSFTCQDCGKKWKKGTRRFDIHHINGLCGKKSKAYDKVSEMDGLITLCHKCHFNRPEHASKKLKSKCKRGHSFSKENTYVYGKRRICRACHRINAKRYKNSLSTAVV